MNPIYFDYASTTQIRKEVLDAMLPYLHEEFGNPSSLYEIGIQNKKIINQCRRKIASLLNCDASEIYFCSGGSEANNWAIKGAAFQAKDKNEIITTKIEHHSILHSCAFLEKLGFTIHYLDVDEEGLIDFNQLKQLINQKTLMVSIMIANNEIGIIQDVEKIGKLCKEHNILFHSDAIQAVSHLKMDLRNTPIDLMSVSAHKFYGPKGIGFLYIRNGCEIENLLHGGAQEKKRRAGTENIAYIVGMTKAFELINQEMEFHNNKERELAFRLYQLLKNDIKDIRLNGPEIGSHRLPGNLNLSFKEIDGNLLSFYLSKQGICVSTGSACNSSSIEPSHVLQAIHVPKEYLKGTIRITIGKASTMDEIKTIHQTLLEYFNPIL